MALHEQARHELFAAARSAIGDGPASTLMSIIPPVDWADVATKQDLAALEERMDERFERMEERMDERFERMEERMDLRFDAMAARMDHMAERLDLKFEGRLHDELRKQSLLFGSWVTAVAGVSIALVQLLSTG